MPENEILALIAFSSNEVSGESAHAHAQTRQSLRCSHTLSIGKDEDPDQSLDV